MSIATHHGFGREANSRFYPAKLKPSGYTLFTLPHVLIHGEKIVTNEKATVSIPIRGKLLDGYSGSYTINMGNGVTGIMIITQAPAKKNAHEEVWEHDRMINNFPLNEIAGDFIELHIKPATNWLEAGQQFHVFKIPIGCPRHSNNARQLAPGPIPDILFGIQRPD